MVVALGPLSRQSDIRLDSRFDKAALRSDRLDTVGSDTDTVA